MDWELERIFEYSLIGKLERSYQSWLTKWSFFDIIAQSGALDTELQIERTDCIRLHVHDTFYDMALPRKLVKKVFVANIINCLVHGSQGSRQEL